MSDSNILIIRLQFAFIPLLPNPVTDPSIFNTTMQNFLALTKKLQQNILPVTCDEGLLYAFLKDTFSETRQIPMSLIND